MGDVVDFLLKGKFAQENFGVLGNLRFIIFNYFKLILFHIILLTILTYFFSDSTEKSTIVESDEIPLYFKLLFICLIMPIIEELAFRLPLDISKNNLIISIVCLNMFLFILTKKHLSDMSSIYKYGMYITVLGLSLYFAIQNYQSILIVLQKNFVTYLHIISISFCLVHYGNFDFTTKSITPYFLMFLIFVNGYYYGYTRLRFGISYAIFIHMFHNILISVPLIIKLLK